MSARKQQQLQYLTCLAIFCSLEWAVVGSVRCGNQTQSDDALPITVHEHKDGRSRCCSRIRCPPGTYGMWCDEGKPHTTHCLQCPEDHYGSVTTNSDDNYACHPMKICDEKQGLYIYRNGTSTKDRVCDCDLSRGFYRSRITDHCLYKGDCGAGNQLTKDGECEPCRPGTYKPEANTDLCIEWTSCYHLGRIQAKYGNTTHDAECGPYLNETIEEPRKDEARGEDFILFPWKLIVAVILPIVIIVVLAVVVIRKLKLCGCKDPDGSGSNDSLSMSQETNDSKNHFPHLNNGGYLTDAFCPSHQTNIDLNLKINTDVHPCIPVESRNSPDSDYGSRASNPPDYCETQQDGTDPMVTKRLLRQDSADSAIGGSQGASTPKVIIVKNMNIVQGEHNHMNIRNSSGASIGAETVGMSAASITDLAAVHQYMPEAMQPTAPPQHGSSDNAIYPQPHNPPPATKYTHSQTQDIDSVVDISDDETVCWPQSGDDYGCNSKSVDRDISRNHILGGGCGVEDDWATGGDTVRVASACERHTEV